MKKRLASILLAIVMMLTLLPATAFAAGNTTEFAGGTGVEGDPYLISTTAHLNNVRNYLGAHFKMVNDIVFTDADFDSGGAFYNGGAGWTPIGDSYANAFTGVFDGNGYAVKNLYIDCYTTDEDVTVGLFGHSKKGVIKNLGLEDSAMGVYVYGFTTAYVGGIVGRVYGGTVSNCYNASGAYVETADGFAKVGGIVGTVSDGTISNCYNSDYITLSEYEGIGGYTDVGGIACVIENGSTISNCYNTGYISATDTAGGIVCSVDESTVSECYNTGSVVGHSRAGGIAADVEYSGTITNCYNTGDVTSALGTRPYAGGIACTLEYGTISNCYNEGEVLSLGCASGIVASVSGSSSKVVNCYNTGEVQAVSGGDALAGGIVYYLDNGTVSNCYNTGYVHTLCENRVGGAAWAGGIVGFGESGTISNCYNVGYVLGTSVVSATYVREGGVVGENRSSTVLNCYYLDKIAKGVGKGTDTAKKCTDAQLQQKSTFNRFDFTNVWTMAGNTAYPYPELLENEHIMPPPSFADIPEDSWQYPFAQYAVENGLMAGKGTDERGNIIFDPNSPIKREEFVQVLYNAEGKPAISIANPFPDVAEGGWYKNAVLWAKQNDIASGKGNGNFGVGENISRQDLAMMLYKYAKLKGYSLDATEGLINGYADGANVASYAKTAMDWAVTNGIMSGKGAAGADLSTFRLDPTGIATRAECAAMLKNFQTAFGG